MRAGDSVQVVGKAIRMRAVSTGWPFRALVRRRWLQCYSMRVLWSWARPCSGHRCLGSRGHRTQLPLSADIELAVPLGGLLR